MKESQSKRVTKADTSKAVASTPKAVTSRSRRFKPSKQLVNPIDVQSPLPSPTSELPHELIENEMRRMTMMMTLFPLIFLWVVIMRMMRMKRMKRMKRMRMTRMRMTRMEMRKMKMRKLLQQLETAQKLEIRRSKSSDSSYHPLSDNSKG